MVTGHGGGTMGAYISNDALIEYAMNDIRNKAGQKGATHVLVAGSPQLGSQQGYTTTADVMGTAYRCAGP
jgi:hypothetical protein